MEITTHKRSLLRKAYILAPRQINRIITQKMEKNKNKSIFIEISTREVRNKNE